MNFYVILSGRFWISILNFNWLYNSNFIIKVIAFKYSDYEGGEIVLTDHATGKSSTIEAKNNRMVLATAGSENIVQHKPVTKGIVRKICILHF